ncbi:MAG TPA: DUF2934 domain-containing protein [Burkholderiales bacterium]|nr:DUF2934 domain-containing protein [Burkholderiales bacterium]
MRTDSIFLPVFSYEVRTMATVQSGKVVLHRGREAPEILKEETEELAEQPEERVPTAERQQMVAVAAYYRAEKRNFEPGHELEDWLAAEAELEAQRIST